MEDFNLTLMIELATAFQSFGGLVGDDEMNEKIESTKNNTRRQRIRDAIRIIDNYYVSLDVESLTYKKFQEYKASLREELENNN